MVPDYGEEFIRTVETEGNLVQDELRIYRIPFVEHYLRKFVKVNSRILDIGCGMGQYRHTLEAFYIGLDVTSEPYGKRPRKVDIVASASDIPAPDRCYDAVFSVGALYQMANPTGVLAEIHRVLRPAGRILLFDYNRRTQKRLEIGEGHSRPCWTQWGLKGLVQQVGFWQCEILPPVSEEVNPIEKSLRLIEEELFGLWALVTGIKR